MAKGPGNPKTKKLTWADQVENEDNGDDLASYTLPPSQVIGSDENGIKTVIHYRFNEEGQMVRVTSTNRVHKVVTRMSKGAIERRSWAKFGDAENDDVGSGLTLVSTEEVFLESSRPQGREVNQAIAGGDAPGQLGNRGGYLKTRRTCGKKGGHFAAMCPYNVLQAPQNEALNYERPSSDAAAAASSKAKSNTYIPPSMREGAKKSIGTDMRRRNEDHSIKISNLSLYAQESDLHELFGRFGPITRIYVPPDHSQPGLNRGFAFVNFVNKDDAEKAINTLNRYGYDNLILKVEWPFPRSK
ncbi:hypothetical protein DITRI_Ditri06bG0079000 [Diplodiscus trichospermus]